MSEMRTEDFSDDLSEGLPGYSSVTRKWAIYRTSREVYTALLEKKRRGDKINFRERGGNHLLTLTTHVPTAEEVKMLFGDGCFVIEHLFDGKPDGYSYSFIEVEPNVRVVAAEQPELSQSATPSPQDALVPLLQQMNQMTQTLARLESGRSDSRLRGRRENRGRLRRRFQAPMPDAPQKLSLADQMREYAEAGEVFEQFKARYMPEREERHSNPKSDESPESTAIRLVLENPKVRERVAGSLSNILGEAPKEKHWLVELGELAFDNANTLPLLGTAVGNLFGSLLGGAPPASLQPPQHAPAPRPVSSTPQPQPNASTPPQAREDEPPNFEHEATVTFTNTLADMSAGKPARASARDLVSLFREFPQESTALRVQLAFPSEVILQSIAMSYPDHASIVTQPGAVAWMDQLKAEIAKRLQPKVKAAASDASNGNGSHAEAVAS